MRDTLENITTAVKMNIPTAGAVATWFTEWEPLFRVASLAITTSLTVYVFIRNNRRIRKQENEEKST